MKTGFETTDLLVLRASKTGEHPGLTFGRKVTASGLQNSTSRVFERVSYKG